jgi:hypothetical protein
MEAAQAELERIRVPLRPNFQGVRVEASAVEDSRRCPRRGFLLHQVGLLPGAGDAATASHSGDFPVRHVAARGGLLALLASRLSPEDWAAGAQDAALAPHLAVLGLSSGEARALGLLAPLQRLATSRALNAAVASGTLRPGWAWALETGPAVLLATPTLAWTEGGRLHLLQLLPGAVAPRGLDAFAVTASVLWHAAGTPTARVGLFFADAEEAEPRWVDAAPLPLEALARAAQALLDGAAGLPPRQPLEVCEALGCGFRFRCHAPQDLPSPARQLA